MKIFQSPVAFKAGSVRHKVANIESKKKETNKKIRRVRKPCRLRRKQHIQKGFEKASYF